MARNTRRSYGKKKLEPAVMNLSFTANSGSGIPGGATNYIDLSMAASVVNRRFYKQGINWSVAGFTITTSGNTAPGSVTVCKVPTTWIAYNAWVKSRAMWNKMNDQVLDSEESIRAKYYDFKVNMNAAMAASTLQLDIQSPGDGDILVPTDCAYNEPTMGEWKYSTLQMPNDPTSGVTTEFVLGILGDSTDHTAAIPYKGCIQGYANSRARPQPFDPNVVDSVANPEENWMTEVFNVGEQLEELREDLEDDNDSPPYPVGDPGSAIEYYPGSATQLPAAEVVGYASFGSTTQGTIFQRSIKGGMFPCGLIAINSNLTGPLFYDIIVHLVPGNHRGYLCEPMEDV